MAFCILYYLCCTLTVMPVTTSPVDKYVVVEQSQHCTYNKFYGKNADNNNFIVRSEGWKKHKDSKIKQCKDLILLQFHNFLHSSSIYIKMSTNSQCYNLFSQFIIFAP